VGLFFDDFSIAARDMPQAKAAAKRFVAASASRGGQIAIFSLSKPLVLPFTSDSALK
jgi:hypothetical protein